MLATAQLSSPLLAVAILAVCWALRRSNDLQDIVSFSSRLIAATRAIESEREDALFVDPFAAVLAGPKALARCRSKTAKKSSPPSTTPRSVSNITCRTKYLDDALHFFVGGGAVSAKMADYLAQIQSAVLAHASAPPQLVEQLRLEQVVLLGAGMDTRAQRLDLPAGTKWFEVDRAEVLRVKHNLLRSMKHKVLQSTSTTVQAAGGELGCSALRHILRNTAFNSGAPTMWILEGLTMYLSPEQNSTLLQEMAELSSCGSMFLMSVVPAENIGVQRSPGSLMSTWKWGFPDTFIEDTEALGWNIVDSIDYLSIAHLYGCKYSRRTAVADATPADTVDPATASPKLTPAAAMVPDRVQIAAAVLRS